MKNKRIILALGMAFLALSIIQSCADIPDGVKAVQNFQKELNKTNENIKIS